MDALIALWLPILLSAVFVFVASSVLHMAIPIHQNDFTKLPKEDEVLAAMRKQGVGPGDYMFPCPASMKDMASPEMVAKYNQGPVGQMTILPNGPINMGRSLLQWFLYSILISVFTAYVSMFALPHGSHYLEVFQVTGAAAVLGYAFASIPNSIWKGVKWSTTAKFVFDGVVYALVTAGTFGWLWPSVAA
ncbi:MAG: hypothetical protein ACYTG2_03920 [Planctomycetota bacterium]|jgi:hypothetical protein